MLARILTWINRAADLGVRSKRVDPSTSERHVDLPAGIIFDRLGCHQLKALVGEGHPIYCEDDAGEKLIEQAGRFGCDELVESWFAADRARYIEPEKTTLLCEAATLGLSNVIGSLVRRGHELDDYEAHGRRPLLLAAKGGHEDAVRTIISLGASNLGNNDDGSVLHLLAAGWLPPDGLERTTDDLKMAALLIDLGTPVNNCHDPGNLASLHCAIESGYLDMVRLLLSCGANPNDHVYRTDAPTSLS